MSARLQGDTERYGRAVCVGSNVKLEDFLFPSHAAISSGIAILKRQLPCRFGVLNPCNAEQNKLSETITLKSSKENFVNFAIAIEIDSFRLIDLQNNIKIWLKSYLKMKIHQDMRYQTNVNVLIVKERNLTTSR